MTALEHSRRESILLTPGPVTISPGVQAALLRGLGAVEGDFPEVVRGIRRELLSAAGLDQAEYDAVLLPGSGAAALEAVIGSAIPRTGRLLVGINGESGRRIARIGLALGVDTRRLEWPAQAPLEPGQIAMILESDPAITHVAVVHCETSTGLLNPVGEIGRVAARQGRALLVDASGSLGGVPMEPADGSVQFMASSSENCLQGLPGVGFVLARRTALERCVGQARGFTYDLAAQWMAQTHNGQLRAAPPAPSLFALGQALEELREEGGARGRATRYSANTRTLLAGMRALGFEPLLQPEVRSHITTAFRYPGHPGFQYDLFSALLRKDGYALESGTRQRDGYFPVAAIGDLYPGDFERFTCAAHRVLTTMGVDWARPAATAEASDTMVRG
ncbi:2-aminoethylphosphonate--pyruvate transaminase [Paludibaculum fermentans]|uniref:2-aminoethylphosphonate--pyruvate transaminase n=1 Tax=Paludibaculum fermentans TaxID=1473598 RepID=A0A7S7SJN3_PALFE|nr:2-aminoethylphosphonate--pyruvate transaminase [Paludibaculum fermentans]QOY86903.1 2-aminoethylphosphonate--pyruvate transaminase [Paludibaculum fermentans]